MKKIQPEPAEYDLENLSSCLAVAAVFLDPELRVRRFTATAANVFELREADLGRSLADIAARLPENELDNDIAGVLKDKETRQRELPDGRGGVQQRRVSPCFVGDRICGVVVTFALSSDWSIASPAPQNGEAGDVRGRPQPESVALWRRPAFMPMIRHATLGEMAGSLAHKLNQPLTDISNYAAAGRRMLDVEPQASARMRNVFERINEQARGAVDYIGRMRDYADLGQPRPRLVNIGQPMEGAVALATPAARAASITLETGCEEGLPPVRIDPIEIEQVMIGLLMNAVEASEHAEGDDRTITLQSRRRGETYVAITVSDRGDGIPEDVLSEIFQPSFTTREGHLGMGLAIGRSIVEANGGRITVERLTPHGARFDVVLPLARR
jgi:signal transduction histidine kinase